MPQAEKSKEGHQAAKLNLSQYNLEDLLEPLAKASAGTARSQYLSVSRYVAGQPSAVRRGDPNVNLIPTYPNSRRNSGLFSKKPGKIDLPSIWNDPMGDITNGTQRTIAGLSLPNAGGIDCTAKYFK